MGLHLIFIGGKSSLFVSVRLLPGLPKASPHTMQQAGLTLKKDVIGHDSCDGRKRFLGPA